MLHVIDIQLLSICIALRQSTHWLWGAILILLHIGAYLTMGIGFRNNCLLLGLLFVASPFVRRGEGWGGVILVPELPGDRAGQACMAQLKSLGVAMAAYVAENDGNYPTPSCINGTWVTSGSNIDNRQHLVDISGGVPEMYWCPLNAGRRPSDCSKWNNPEVPFAKHFADAKQVPSTGMLIPFIIIDTARGQGTGQGLQWDLRHSGNPDGPWFPGDSSAIVITETGYTGETAPVAPDWKTNLKCSTHTGCVGGYRESDSLWGDGHVESRTTPEKYVFRLGPPSVSVY